jgi:hypothetical protein
MFRAKGAREKDFPEHVQGDEAFGARKFVLERVVDRKPEDGRSGSGSLKSSGLR